jgi:gluconate 2-dehydrogenase gamma chain
MIDEPDELQDRGLTRRGLLARAGVAAAALGVATVADACGTESGSGVGPEQLSGDTTATAFPPVPPMNMPMPGVHGFFTKDEARAVDAFASRILPGSPEDPGAHELGVVTFIDHKLASFHTFATPTYFKGPFAQKTPDHPGPQPHARDVILVNDEELPRYGFQSNLTPQQAYRKGLAALESYAQGAHGRSFADLGHALQDSIIGLLEIDKVKTFTSPGGGDFFTMLQEDVNEGAFSDPMYGGNRRLAGWALVGYPGAQRAYTAYELAHGPQHKRLQGLREMMSENPGQPQPRVFLPISGTERTAMGG